MAVRNARVSRGFLIWRTICGVLFGLISVAAILQGLLSNNDVGTQPGWYMLVLGFLPTSVVLAAAKVCPNRAYVLALVHDLILFVILIAELLFLPNYLALIILSPLIVFVVEGIVLTLGFRRDKLDISTSESGRNQ